MIGENQLNQQYAMKAAYEAQRYQESTGYPGDVASIQNPGSLVRLTDQIAEAAARIDQVANQLSMLAIGIHGPRPEPVDSKGVPPNQPDSLASRVNRLLETVERLQRSYESIVR